MVNGRMIGNDALLSHALPYNLESCLNSHPTLATPVHGEDVQVGFILKPDMSDAELYPEHHGRTLQST